ncbi:MAG: hypothetical protein HY512_01055 [Candidatus Aenigmarchaeota archaeon]|nr:hypothetical protein [Candidatus Aenigmarchaeota archaeon]
MKRKNLPAKKKLGNWFRAALVAVPTLVGGYWANNRGYLDDLPLIGYTETETDGLADRFPESFPGATNVRKYKHSGSRYLLVHIKTTHTITSDQFEQRREIGKVLGKQDSESLEDINMGAMTVFDSVSGLVSGLSRLYSLDSVYIEGLTKGNDVLLNDLIDEMVRVDPEVATTRDMERMRTVARTALSKLYPDAEVPEFPQEFASTVYTGLKATLNGRLWAAPAESKATLTSALDAQSQLIHTLKQRGYDNHEIGNVFRMVDDNREDALLSLLSGAPSGNVFVVVYGAGHSWADNIKEWNRTHKKDRFSLVEVNPNGL